MKALKITGNDKENILERVLNIASMIARSGSLTLHVGPEVSTELKKRYPLWIKKKDGGHTYDLFPIVNNYWAHERSRDESHVTISFRSRYGNEKFNRVVFSALEMILDQRERHLEILDIS